MKTRIAVLAAAALLGALAGPGGCAENSASVQTQMICMPTTSCEFSATCDAQYIGYPTLDKSTSGDGVLWLFLQVANNTPNNGDLGVGRTNTNDAHIDEIYVEYEGAMGGSQTFGAAFDVPAGGTAVVSARFALGGSLAGEVVAHLRFRGYFDDRTRFETGDFPITIQVCASGCAPAASQTTCDPTKPYCPKDGQLPYNCTTT